MYPPDIKRRGPYSLTSRSYLFLVMSLAAIAGLTFGIGLVQVFLLHVGHDPSWCVYAADLVLHGVQLDGPQLVEVNPPFIIWFSCLPVLLGRLLHVGILDGFRIFFDLTVAFSVLWTTLLIKRFFSPTSLSIWLFILAQSVCDLILIRRDSPGQREHFLFLLVLPYLILAASRCRQSAVRLGFIHEALIGLTAAAAICLKPQHILVVLLVELLIIIQVRTFRALSSPAVAAFASGISLYGLSVLLFGRPYIENVMPKLRIVYAALNRPYVELFVHRTPFCTVAILVMGIVFLARYSHVRYNSLAAVLSVAAIGSTLAYIQQHKGWTYHFIPAELLTVFFVSTLLIGAIEERVHHDSSDEVSFTGRRNPATSLAAFFCLAAIIVAWRFERPVGYLEPGKVDLARLLSAYPAGSAVAYISIYPWDMPVIVDQHKVLGQRINYFWLLPAIFLSQDRPSDGNHFTLPTSEIEQLSTYQRLSMAQDLAHWKPVVVVIDECGPELCELLKREHYETLLRWFLLNPDFAREWQHYQLAGAIGELQAFRRID